MITITSSTLYCACVGAAPRSAITPLLDGEIPPDSNSCDPPEKPWKEIRVLAPHDNVQSSKSHTENIILKWIFFSLSFFVNPEN